MVDKNRESISSMFDSIAPKYDLLNHLLSAGVDKGWRKKLVRLVSKSEPIKILDMATGTADLAIALAKGCRGAEVTGGDISVKMLEVGREKVSKESLDDRVKLMECDATAIGMSSNSFDVVTCAFGVRNFENLRQGLSEMYRVCNDGGRVVVLEFSRPKNSLLMKFYMFYFKNILPLIGSMVSKDRRAYEYLPESVLQFPSGSDFLAILKDIGLKDCGCQPLTMGIATIYYGVKK